jgi:hypothetical protein
MNQKPALEVYSRRDDCASGGQLAERAACQAPILGTMPRSFSAMGGIGTKRLKDQIENSCSIIQAISAFNDCLTPGEKAKLDYFRSWLPTPERAGDTLSPTASIR